jgi:hypothetical protein
MGDVYPLEWGQLLVFFVFIIFSLSLAFSAFIRAYSAAVVFEIGSYLVLAESTDTFRLSILTNQQSEERGRRRCTEGAETRLGLERLTSSVGTSLKSINDWVCGASTNPSLI